MRRNLTIYFRHRLGISLLTAFACCFFLIPLSPVLADEPSNRLLREMRIHRDVEIGLEIWTETNPRWTLEKRYVESKAVLLTQTPPLVYPPASMTISSFANMQISDADFEVMRRAALEVGLKNFGVSLSASKYIIPIQKQYGELTGYEIDFKGIVHGKPSDVKVFIGRSEGKGPIVLQLYTLEGKMPHLSEQIRRSWNQIKYITND